MNRIWMKYFRWSRDLRTCSSHPSSPTLVISIPSKWFRPHIKIRNYQRGRLQRIIVSHRDIYQNILFPLHSCADSRYSKGLFLNLDTNIRVSYQFIDLLTSVKKLTERNDSCNSKETNIKRKKLSITQLKTLYI